MIAQIVAKDMAMFTDESCDELLLGSDSSTSTSDYDDLELKPADYWQCVKCKNKQNNPMYRYCEKCYQVRERQRMCALIRASCW